jgi:hypothetical protein
MLTVMDLNSQNANFIILKSKCQLNKHYLKKLRIFTFNRRTGNLDLMSSNSGCIALIPSLPQFGLVNRNFGNGGVLE